MIVSRRVWVMEPGHTEIIIFHTHTKTDGYLYRRRTRLEFHDIFFSSIKLVKKLKYLQKTFQAQTLCDRRYLLSSAAGALIHLFHLCVRRVLPLWRCARTHSFFRTSNIREGLYLHLAQRMTWKPILRATRLTYTLRSRIRTVRDSPRFPLPDRSYHIMLAQVTLYLTDQPTT